MPDQTPSDAPRQRVIVVLKRPKSAVARNPLLISMIAALVALVLGAGLGFQGASIFGPLLSRSEADNTPPALTQRVSGGVYALELAKPQGQSRWMLEFDAEIKTSGGPNNPAELRNALERLVIETTAMPIVQSADDPSVAMRQAMLAVASQDYPWLVDVYLVRSDLRAPNRKLESIGAALRNED